MWAVLVNGGACLLGGFIGFLLKKIIKKEICDGMLKAVGLVVIIVGIEGCISPILDANNNSTELMLLLVISLVLGTGIGEILKIDTKLTNFGLFLEKKLIKSHEEGSFSKGFINASLIFCTGAMAIVGGIEASMNEPQTYLVKSLIDGVTAIALAATLGYGVCFSAISVLLYQGLIVLFGNFLNKFMPESFTAGFAVIGYVMVLGIGINFLMPEKYKIKIANMLPSLLFVIVYYIIFN